MPPARSRGICTATLLLLGMTVLRAGAVDPTYDLGNLLTEIEGVPAAAAAQADSATRKAYDTLVYGLRTAPDGLVNTAVNNARYASETGGAIDVLTRNTLAVRPDDLSSSVTALRSCIDALRAAARATVSIIEPITSVKAGILSESDPGKRTDPLSANAVQAISSVKLAAAEWGKLSALVMSWSAAMERVSRQASQFAAAISDGRYRELAVNAIQFQQAAGGLKKSLDQIRTQTVITKDAIDLGRRRLGAAGSPRPEYLDRAESLLARSAAAVDQVSSRYGTLNVNCSQCANAVDLYTRLEAELWANSRSRFLGTLPIHLRSAVEDLDQNIARAQSLSSAVKGSVESSLSAGQMRMAAPDHGMRTAVRDRSQDLLTMLRSRSDPIWELDLAGVTAQVDSLVTLASKQVAAEVRAVAEVAWPRRSEAERQLSELVSIARQTVQLHQQLTIHANGPGMVARPGYTPADIKTPPGSSFRTVPIDAEATARETARDLQAKLQPLLRQLSDQVARERSRRGIR